VRTLYVTERSLYLIRSFIRSRYCIRAAAREWCNVQCFVVLLHFGTNLFHGLAFLAEIKLRQQVRTEIIFRTEI